MTFYRPIFAFPIFLFSFLFFSCKSAHHSQVKRLPGTWQGSPIIVDGSNGDWPSPYPEYDDKAMLGYCVSNDKDYLYITVETGDPATQLKILKEGLTVWIDRKGEKNEETAINYPIPESATGAAAQNSSRPRNNHFSDGQGGNRADQQRLELEDRIRAALPKADQYSLQGFKSCNLQYAIAEKDSCGVQVKMTLDSMNELVWEAKVPFRSFYFKPEISRPDKGRPITICFETVGMKRPAGQGSGNGGGGGMRPSMGFGGGMGMGMRMGGGGMHGGNRGGGQQTNSIMEPAYKSTKTYKKVGIAFQ